jgi:hypothetical protein
MFRWTMENKTLEQLLFYVIMSNFFMMISGYFLTFQHNQDEMIIEHIRQLMTDKNKSIIYKVGFWILKYIQSLVLIILLYMGYTELNHFANLMFMLFFVVYTAFINFYRLTSKSMTILFSYLICMRYFYSLNYHKLLRIRLRCTKWPGWDFSRAHSTLYSRSRIPALLGRMSSRCARRTLTSHNGKRDPACTSNIYLKPLIGS